MALRSGFRAQIGHLDDGPMWVNGNNGRSGENFLSTVRCAWAIPGGIPSGWGQFGAVKKWAVLIGGLRRQLNALSVAHLLGGWLAGLVFGWVGCFWKEKEPPS